MALSPKDVVGFDKKAVKEIVEKIDEKLRFAGECRNSEWFDVILPNEYREDLRNSVAKEYIDAGWDMVVHQTSTENGERPGITYFAFLTENTIDSFFKEYVDTLDKRKIYYVITKDKIKSSYEEKKWGDLNGNKS